MHMGKALGGGGGAEMMMRHKHRRESWEGKVGAGPGRRHSSTHTALPTRAPPSHWLGSAAGPASGSSRVLWLAAPPGGESVLLLASSLLPLSSAKLLRQNGI